MNILHISSNYPPRIGGPATSVPELAKRLAEKGHSVHVVTVKFLGYDAHSTEDNYHVHRALNINKDASTSNTLSNVFSILTMGMMARKIISKDDIDVVHAHDLNLSAAAGIISTRLNKKPLITKYTGDLSLEYLLLLEKLSFKELQEKYARSAKSNLPFVVRLLDRFQKYMAEKSTIVTAPSEFQKEMLLSQNIDEDSVVVLRNAVDLEKFNPNVPPAVKKEGGEKILLYAGRLVPWKGVDYLIEAFAKFNESYDKKHRLLIVGDGPSMSNLQELAKKLNVDDQIAFIGKKPNNQISGYIASSDIVVLPSLYDPFPHTMLETLAMRKPLIATSVGGIPEVVKHKETGYLVNPGDVNELASAIDQLMNDDALIRQINAKGYEHIINNYSWDILIHDFIRLYEKLGKN